MRNKLQTLSSTPYELAWTLAARSSFPGFRECSVDDLAFWFNLQAHAARHGVALFVREFADGKFHLRHASKGRNLDVSELLMLGLLVKESGRRVQLRADLEPDLTVEVERFHVPPDLSDTDCCYPDGVRVVPAGRRFKH